MTAHYNDHILELQSEVEKIQQIPSEVKNMKQVASKLENIQHIATNVDNLKQLGGNVEILQQIPREVEKVGSKRLGDLSEEVQTSGFKKSRTNREIKHESGVLDLKRGAGGKNIKMCASPPKQAYANVMLKQEVKQERTVVESEKVRRKRSSKKRQKALTPEQEHERGAVQQSLHQHVEPGTQLYKHEAKKARDRLYKRLKRDQQSTDDISEHEVEVEMLTYMTAKKQLKSGQQLYIPDYSSLGPVRQEPNYPLPSPPALVQQGRAPYTSEWASEQYTINLNSEMRKLAPASRSLEQEYYGQENSLQSFIESFQYEEAGGDEAGAPLIPEASLDKWTEQQITSLDWGHITSGSAYSTENTGAVYSNDENTGAV